MAQAKVDFLIITTLEEERDAILRKFTGWQKLPPSEEDIRVYYSAEVLAHFPNGMVVNYRVIITMLLNMGRVNAANATNDAVRRWDPKYILLVGIAAGISGNDVKLGDILISEQIADYELQQLKPKSKEVYWEIHRADPRLLSSAQNFDQTKWQEMITRNRPGPGEPKCRWGPIATGDKVVELKRTLDTYRNTWPKLIGVEREAGGVASAACQSARNPGFFMIRGVSDLADVDKTSEIVADWRLYACDVAAAYTVAFLQGGPIPPEKINIPRTKKQQSNESTPSFKLSHPGFPRFDIGMRLVARKADVAKVKALLRKHKSVTLLGPGGIGKTTLAKEIQKSSSRQFQEGIFFVELARITQADLVFEAIAQALHIRLNPYSNSLEELIEQLRYKRVLVILDNCDHVIGSCAKFIAAVSNSTHSTKVLATCREMLTTEQEVYEVGPLQMMEAVELFAARALMYQREFRVDEKNHAMISAICTRLACVPLSIELAVAQLGVLSMAQISQKIESHFLSFPGGNTSSQDYHQTMNSTLEWSYNLLSLPDKDVLHNLSILLGTWSLEAAEKISADPEKVNDETFLTLQRLINKSFVQRVRAEGRDEFLFRCLEPIREFAYAKLAASSDFGDVQKRHCDWFLEQACETEKHLWGAKQHMLADQLEMDHGNFTRALNWSIQQEPNSALKMAAALGRFWQTKNHFEEGMQWLVRTMERCSSPDLTDLAKAHLFAGSLAPDEATGLPHNQQALRLYRLLHSKHGEAEALMQLGMRSLFAHGLKDAQAYFRQALRFNRESGDERSVAASLHSLGMVARERSNRKIAIILFGRSLSGFKNTSDLWGEASALEWLAAVHMDNRDYSVSIKLYKQSLEIYEALGNTQHVALITNLIAETLERSGEYEQAVSFYKEAYLLARKVGDWRDIANAVEGLAYLEYERGDISRAKELYKQAIQEYIKWYKQHRDKSGLVYCFEGLAGIVAYEGDHMMSARLFGMATTLAEGISRKLERGIVPQRDINMARQELGMDLYADIAKKSQNILLERAVSIALKL